MNSIAIIEAVNTTSLPFHGQSIITAMAAGVAYVAMKPIVENLGMSWGTQQQKLMRQMDKFNCIHMNMVAGDSKLRQLLCIPLKKLNGWLFSINPAKVRDDIRDRLVRYQEECFTALHDYWTKGEAKNPRYEEPEAKPKKSRQSTAKQLTPLRQVAERLITTGLGKIYPDIWKLVHKRFEVQHIAQLKPSEIGEAIEYLNVLEGEFIGKQEVKPDFASDIHNINVAYMYLDDIYDIWKNELYPSLVRLGSPLAAKLYDPLIDARALLNIAKNSLERKTGVKGMMKLE